MTFIKAKDFTVDRAWGALGIANMNGVTTRLHWTDQPSSMMVKKCLWC